MKLTRFLVTAFAGALFFVSCSSDDDTVSAPSGAYDNGVLILNQGGFNAGNASVSFLSDGLAQENNIFTAVNPAITLGDVGQDIGLHDDMAYIVVNNSHKIEVVNRYTFQHITTITAGLDNPRYIAFSGGKGYVTNWGNPENPSDDYIAVIDLSLNTVTSTIPVAEGPERIIEEDGKLYVAHYGGYSIGNTVTVINAGTNTVATTVTVGDAPQALDIEDGKLYVLCEGKPAWTGDETAGELHVINVGTNAVTNTMAFANGVHPHNITEEDGKLYYTVDADVYRMDAGAVSIPETPFFTVDAISSIYSLGVEDGRIYLGDAGDFNSNGKVYVYSATGELQNSFTVGVIPAGFYFND